MQPDSHDDHNAGAPRLITALRKTASGRDAVALQQLPMPRPGSNEVLIEVMAAGVCGTDIHILDDEYPSLTPVTMGHEVAGVVREVGPGTDGSWLGKRVAVETYFETCEKCTLCRSGRRNLCPDRRSIGSYADGGFADYLVIPVTNLHEVPEWVGDHAAALCEPLACVCQCLLDPSVVSAGDRVLVVGPGAMGLLAAQVAKAQGGIVTVSGLASDETRLVSARSLGLEAISLPPGENVADVVIECSGSAGGVSAALRAARRGARYVAIGILGRPVEIDLDLVLYKELTISSGFASTPQSWNRAIALLAARQVDLEPLVGRIASLDEWETVFSEVRDGRGMKAVFAPG